MGGELGVEEEVGDELEQEEEIDEIIEKKRTGFCLSNLKIWSLVKRH